MESVSPSTTSAEPMMVSAEAGAETTSRVARYTNGNFIPAPCNFPHRGSSCCPTFSEHKLQRLTQVRPSACYAWKNGGTTPDATEQRANDDNGHVIQGLNF